MIMFFLWLIISLLSIRECTQTPNYGKITIKNKSTVVIRVTLSPAINWNYYEQRTNRTLLRNPDKITGGNIIMWVDLVLFEDLIWCQQFWWHFDVAGYIFQVSFNFLVINIIHQYQSLTWRWHPSSKSM